jgi:hypothetical protein
MSIRPPAWRPHRFWYQALPANSPPLDKQIFGHILSRDVDQGAGLPFEYFLQIAIQSHLRMKEEQHGA